MQLLGKIQKNAERKIDRNGKNKWMRDLEIRNRQQIDSDDNRIIIHSIQPNIDCLTVAVGRREIR